MSASFFYIESMSWSTDVSLEDRLSLLYTVSGLVYRCQCGGQILSSIYSVWVGLQMSMRRTDSLFYIECVGWSTDVNGDYRFSHLYKVSMKVSPFSLSLCVRLLFLIVLTFSTCLACLRFYPFVKP